MVLKSLNMITSISLVLTIVVTVLSFIGIVITGFYPGMMVLLLITLIPIGSKYYIHKIHVKQNDLQSNYFTTIIIANLLSILAVLWMTFVIMIDRVFSKIL